MKKRLFAMLLALTMVLTFMPALAFADEEAAAEAGNETPAVEEQTEEAVIEEAPAEEAEEEPDAAAAVEEEPAAEEEPEVEQPASEKAEPETRVRAVAEVNSDEDEDPEPISVSFSTSNTLYGYIGTDKLAEQLGQVGDTLVVVYSDGTRLTYNGLGDGEFEISDSDTDIAEEMGADWGYFGLDVTWRFADAGQTKFNSGNNAIYIVLLEEIVAEQSTIVTGKAAPPAATSLVYTQKAGNDPLEAYVGVRKANWLNYNWPQEGDTLRVYLNNGNYTTYTYNEYYGDFVDVNGENIFERFHSAWWLSFKGDQTAYTAGNNTVRFCFLDNVGGKYSDESPFDESNVYGSFKNAIMGDVTVKGVASNVKSISFSKKQVIECEKEEYVEEEIDYDPFGIGDVLTVTYTDNTKNTFTYYEEDGFVDKHGSSNDENWDYADAVDYYDDQDENPWTEGYYSFTVNYQGKEYVAKNAVHVTKTAHEHDMEYEEGYEGYCGGDEGRRPCYYCYNCGRYFEDEEGTVELSEEDLVLPVPDHEWGEWEENTPAGDDYPGDMIRYCQNCGEEEIRVNEHEHRVVFIEEVPATCDEDEGEGVAEHYECEICHESFADEAATQAVVSEDLVIPPIPHDYGEPVYTWSADNRTVTAEAVCSRDHEHVLSETARAGSAVKVKATCKVKGTTTYTAAFRNEAFETQTKDVQDIPVDSSVHTWGAGTVVTKATASAMGKRKYTCTTCGSSETRTDIPKAVSPTGQVKILNTVANSAKKTNDVIWDKSKVKNATGYEISWRARGASKWASKKVGNTTRGATTGLTIGGLYEIRVRPYKAATATTVETYGTWSPVVYRYFHTTGKIRLSSNSKGSFTMNWAKNSAATGYQILYTTNKNGSGAANNIITASASETSKTIKTIKVNGKAQALKSGTTYYVQIREIKKVGTVTYIGNISCPLAVKVK